jgi:ABC-type sugar transport system ATPase subunit
MTLSGERVCKSYGNRTILENCSLSVRAGECVLLRGPSGGGKSTFLRILALLEPADSGFICHGDKRWEAKRPEDVSPYPFLTVVFQQLFLWPNLTMKQNLSIVLKHDPGAALSQSALETLDRLSIRHLLERRPHECSLGERQRLAIARSLLSEARFLLLDEPSSALDRVNRGILVQELSKALVSNRGVLLVTHDDHGFDELAHQSFMLENGRLERA